MMKQLLTVLFCIGLAIFLVHSCGESSESQQDALENQSAQTSVAPRRPPTPEEAMGLEMPGQLAAAVDGWIQSNEFGDYYRQSKELLADLRAKLVEDYRMRQESGVGENSFSREMRRQYDEAVEADKVLRAHFVECFSRKEVKPLPSSIARRFTTAMEERGDMRELLASAPGELAAFAEQLAKFRNEFAMAGTASWAQERSVAEWRAAQNRLADLAARVNQANASVTALAARLAAVVRRTHSDDADALHDRADTLKTDCGSLARRIAAQLEIVTGQAQLQGFVDNCRALREGVGTVSELLARKRARCEEIKQLTSQMIASRQQGYANLNALAQRAAGVKARSQREGAEEAEVGRRVQGLAGNYSRVFGQSAIYKLKRDVPEPSVHARIDAELAALMTRLNVSSNADATGTFANLEAKAWQIADRADEEALIKRMDETLNTVRRVAERR